MNLNIEIKNTMNNKLLLFLFLITSLYTSAQLNENTKSTKKNELIYQFLSTSNISNKLDLNRIINDDPDYIFRNNKFYWGDVKNGLPNGCGLFYIKDSAIFIGEFINGKRNGYGIGMNQYEIYIGEYFNETHSGFGTTYTFNNKMNYEARLNYFISNQIAKIIHPENIKTEKFGISSKIVNADSSQTLNGRKIYYFNDTISNKIEFIITEFGNFVNNNLINEGVKKYESINNNLIEYIEMNYYNFTKKNNDTNALYDKVSYYIKKNGVTIKEGQFKKDTLVNGRISIYTEDYKNGLFTFEGKSINKEYWYGKLLSNTTDYTGNFKKFSFHGKGVLKSKFNTDELSPTGSYFEGTFIEGNMKEGTLFNTQTNDSYKGSFVNGLLEGKVKVLHNGKESEAIFKNGVKQNNSLSNNESESQVLKLYQLIKDYKF